MENNKVLTIISAINLVAVLALTGFVAKIATDDAPVAVADPVQVAVQPIKYEYRIDTIPDLAWDTKTQELGQEGWGLVFARRATSEDEAMYECIFQRQSRLPDL